MKNIPIIKLVHKDQYIGHWILLPKAYDRSELYSNRKKDIEITVNHCSHFRYPDDASVGQLVVAFRSYLIANYQATWSLRATTRPSVPNSSRMSGFLLRYLVGTAVSVYRRESNSQDSQKPAWKFH